SQELGERGAMRRLGEHRADTVAGDEPLERVEPAHARGRAALPPRRGRIEHDAAADRVLGACVPDDEPVAWQRRDRRIEHELRPRGPARGQAVRVENYRACYATRSV